MCLPAKIEDRTSCEPNINLTSRSVFRDTTATTLSSIIYELCLHPEHMEKLRQLVAPYMTDPSGDVLNEKVTHIDHLNGVIYESLRLHPPVPAVIQRKTPPEGIWIGETHIPGNMHVFCPQYAIGRST